MKTLAAPTLTEKSRSLEPNLRKDLSAFFDSVAKMSDAQLDVLKRRSQLLDRRRGIYVARQGALRVFYSTGEEGGQGYLLALDVAPASRPARRGLRRSGLSIDPRLNPYVNTALNPFVNTALNPFVNTRLNPYVNTSLNPFVNTTLNPFVNTVLNIYVNTAINPFVNTSLNPTVNRLLNPNLNPDFPGIRFYDSNLLLADFAVEATSDLFLRFGPNLEFEGIGVRNGIEGYTLFDSNNTWDGYLVPAGDEAYVRFDLSGNWLGVASR